jgi:DNA end-binding protein Ku
MARAIWSGSISFGLLNVPVKLYSAVARRGISLREIRESDGARIRHRRVAEGTDEEVPYEKIVKAFEISPDRYVPLSKEEMASLDPKKTRAIEVQDFVEIAEIDPIYFDSPYYLGPADGAEKAYSLLAQAMEESGKVAIARFVFRNKEHLAAIRPSNEGVLTLTTMRFADEVVPPSELDDVLPEGKPKVAKREIQMAEQLIDSLTRSFDPGVYRDEYREELLAMIERKAAGEEVMAAPQEDREPTKAPDLMAALEESIAAVQGKRESKPAKKPAAKKRKTAAKKPAAKTSAKKKSGSRAKAKSSK